MSPETILEARGITKRFGNLVANDSINFSLYKGEIHALLGENGAGKTTFCNIIYGYLRPDSGEILLEGNSVRFKSPKDAMRHGIGMVHQDFMLIQNMTVVENLSLLLDASVLKPFVKTQNLINRVKMLSEIYGLNVGLEKKIEELSAAEKQKVEILKCLFLDAKIIIFDEPTSYLTEIETGKLFEGLKKMKKEGRSIIFVTHKMDEVMEIADRITVLRQGKVVSCIKREEATKERLSYMIIGRELISTNENRFVSSSPPVLRLESVSAKNNVGTLALKDVSLTLRKNEIVGVVGVAGNGQRELDEVITGMRKVVSGKVYLEEEDITNISADQARKKGIAHICEEHRTGFVFDLSLKENLIISPFIAGMFKKGPFLDKERLEKTVSNLIKEYSIVAESSDAKLGSLSGGNKQKFLLARELFWGPKVIVANNPTKGLDIAASNFIKQKLVEEKYKGKSILMISSDLDEVMEVSDRIAVINSGRIVKVMSVSEVNTTELAYLMTKS